MKKVLILLLCLLIIIFMKTTYADTNYEIKKFLDDIAINFENIELIEDSNKKQEELFILSNNFLDLNWMGNFILGRFKNIITEEQKTEFIKLYSKLLIKNYISVLTIYKKDSYKILSINEQKVNIIIVETTVKYGNSEVKNNFRIIKNENKYAITDIITEGISFISTQRSEVNSILTSKGIDKFLEDLRSKDATN